MPIEERAPRLTSRNLFHDERSYLVLEKFLSERKVTLYVKINIVSGNNMKKMHAVTDQTVLTSRNGTGE